VVGAFCLLPYFYLQPEPLMTPMYWNLVFTALNLSWIVRLLLERRPVKLSEEEKQLCELVFRRAGVPDHDATGDDQAPEARVLEDGGG
jgi:hypothetical protein